MRSALAGTGGEVVQGVADRHALLPTQSQAVGGLLAGEAAPLGKRADEDVFTGVARGVDEPGAFGEGGSGEALAQLAAFLGPGVQVPAWGARSPGLHHSYGQPTPVPRAWAISAVSQSIQLSP
ncbi:hypothetical protein [Actinomadura litoris]|uniref:hypothetical protein n=1 Tax=Actinomadura litoris TaxID=2678616 RepID=UPI001FA76F07|nr:hypothetical protein [Actinomadura litoris]